MKHLCIDATWPDGHVQDELSYGVNWRRIRALLRRQKKERPKCTFRIRRIKPWQRWALNAYTYRDLKNWDRNEERDRQGHPRKWK